VAVSDVAISRLAALALPATRLLRHEQSVPRNDNVRLSRGSLTIAPLN
jgi:hypothetical protein